MRLQPIEVASIYGLMSILVFVFAGAFGWGSNIYLLFSGHDTMKVAEIVIRLVGILLFPIGMVAGFC